MENILPILSSVIPPDVLSTFRTHKDLEPYLPLEVNGLTITWDDTIGGDIASQRQNVFLRVNNTPEMHNDRLPYDPRDIKEYYEDEVPRDYNPEFVEWEGDWQVKPKGGRNFFHLLEQALTMSGATPGKRGATPWSWPVFYKALDKLIAQLKARLDTPLQCKHMVIGTTGSDSRVLKLGHVLGSSSGGNRVTDPTLEKQGKRMHKRDHAREAVSGAKRFILDTDSLPLYKTTVLARGDRAAPLYVYKDSEKAVSRAVLEKKDRKIDGQAYELIVLDGIFTQVLQDAIATNDVPEIDIRDPVLLSNHMVTGMGITQSNAETAFSIGSDESGWDQRGVTPQMWYATYCIYEALFAERQSILVFESDAPSLRIDDRTLTLLRTLEPGPSLTMELPHPTDKGVDVMFETTITRIEFDTAPVLRRLFAGCSATDLRFGNVVVSGLKSVIDTPRHGKILLGFSQRSGNLCTFLSNSLMNWHKGLCIEAASQDANSLEEFNSLYGYYPPGMKLLWAVYRGDDAGLVWNLETDQEKDWKISELQADWIKYSGGTANASKQETSDVRGRWLLGYAQLFFNEEYPRGASSALRVAIDRDVFREGSETIQYHPVTGESLGEYMATAATLSRLNNLWGVFNRSKHPQAEKVTGIIQDITPSRLLPPDDQETRDKIGLVIALRLYRRGQIASEQIDDVTSSFWTTEMFQFLTQRFKDNAKLRDPNWSPIPRLDEKDARPIWRKQLRDDEV